MLNRLFVPVIAVIDLALLMVIIVSPGSSGGKDSGKESIQTQITQEEESSFLADADLSEDIPGEGSSEKSQASADTASGQKNTGSSQAPFSGISVFDTSERPTAADFTWITPDIIAGRCPAESENMNFPEALGGWKCYIWDGEGIERFANMDFAGTEDNLRLTFDWYYTYVGSEGRGYDDNTPDSVYKGALAGNVEAYGPGRVVLTDFYRMNDHQYAFGSIQWPDGISGHLTLVRP